MYPASLTKLLTALVVLHNVRDLSKPVTVSERAAKTPASTAALEPRERLTVRELLEASLVRSANDACVALAEHVAGSVERFMRLMNWEAKVLGCVKSHFVNPHGLHHPSHYSCAYDLSLIARASMFEPETRRIVKEKLVIIESLDGSRRVYRNRNLLLWRYSGADGMKTGYTKESGKCLIGSAQKGGMRLIAVVLDSPDPYADCEALLDWGFSQFLLQRMVRRGKVLGHVKVKGGRPSRIPAVTAEDGYVVTSKGIEPRLSLRLRQLRPPVCQGEVVGEAICQGVGVFKTPLVAARSSEPVPWWERGAKLILGALVPVLVILKGIRCLRRSAERKKGSI